MDGKELLSEDFDQMAAKIIALNEKKKELKIELKETHERIKAEIADLEQEASNLHAQFMEGN